jgi:N-acetylmuramoyl-L-alanine amidase
MRKFVAAAAVIFSLLGTSVAQASTIHTVLPGEGLWNVGAEHQMPYSVVRRANNLTSDALRTGQFLRIPEKYLVKRGDSLWLISQQYGLPVDTLRYVNNEWDGELNVGQVLYLPTPLRNVVWLNSADLDLFQRLVTAEAKGETFEGQEAVASVVLNRVKSQDFPITVRGVILQYYGSVPAFSPVDNGAIYQPATAMAKEAVRRALLGYDYSLGAQYFYNPDLTDWRNWVRSRPITKAIGHHLFAR